MTPHEVGLAFVLALATCSSAGAQPYAARQAGDVVQLRDVRTGMAVSLAPGIGNIGIALTVNGSEAVWWPHASLDEFVARPGLGGIPFLGPWANRLDEQAFYANGRRYAFDMALGNVRGEIPIHGFLRTARWHLVEAAADETSAWATSRLDFYRQPASMSQFPFAHTIEMTYRLRGHRR